MGAGMTLEWRRLPTPDISYVSACGRYAVGFDGQNSVWRSYRLAPGGPWFAPIFSPQATESASKALCEAEAR